MKSEEYNKIKEGAIMKASEFSNEERCCATCKHLATKYPRVSKYPRVYLCFEGRFTEIGVFTEIGDIHEVRTEEDCNAWEEVNKNMKGGNSNG